MNLVGVAKPTRKQTHYALKPKRTNHARILSDVLIAEVTIKQTQIYVHSGRTALIESST